MSADQKTVSVVQQSAEKVRDLLRLVRDNDKSVDWDVLYKEIRSEFKEGLVRLDLHTLDSESNANLVLTAIDDCVYSITTEYFTTPANDVERLMLNKSIDIFLGASIHILEAKAPGSERYARAIRSRIQSIQAIVQVLLRQECFTELETYTAHFAEQLELMKRVATTERYDRLQARHAETVLQLCHLENSYHSEPYSDAPLEFLYLAKNVCSDEFPALRNHLSLRAYSIGLDCYRNGHYERSVSYFRESFALGKKSTDVHRQSETLYLLGCAYLLWDREQHWQKAVNAIDMAVWHQPGVLKHLTKKLEALYSSGDEGSLFTALNAILTHDSVTLECALAVHQGLKDRGLSERATEFLQRAYIRFQEERDSLRLLIEILKCELESGNLDRASVTFEKILAQDVKGVCHDEMRRLGMFLFRFGCQRADTGNVEEAVMWLKNCDLITATFGDIHGAQGTYTFLTKTLISADTLLLQVKIIAQHVS